MKQSAFTEERIIAILRARGGIEDRGRSRKPRDQQRDVLKAEGKVWWAHRPGGPAPDPGDHGDAA